MWCQRKAGVLTEAIHPALAGPLGLLGRRPGGRLPRWGEAEGKSTVLPPFCFSAFLFLISRFL